LRGGLELALSAGRSMVSLKVLKRLPSLVTFLRSDHDDQPPAPELLSIAVTAAVRGRGVGRGLIAEMETAFKGWGFRGRYRVSTNVGEGVSNAFYRAMGVNENHTL